MNIYLHADDAGLSQQNCDIILRAWESGIIDGFSIIANRNTEMYLRDYFQYKDTRPARISVHLNLADGKPLADPSSVPLLIGSDGEMCIGFMKALFICAIGGNRKIKFLEQVEREWNMQVRFIKNMLGSYQISGIDGHNHIHMVPALFRLANKIRQEQGISRIRLSKEKFQLAGSWLTNARSWFFINLVKHIVLNILSAINSKLLLPEERKNRIAGVLYSGHMNETVVAEMMKHRGTGDISECEIIFHPGIAIKEDIQNWTSHHKMIRFCTSVNRNRELHSLKSIHAGS